MKVITSLLLVLSLLFGVISFTACTAFDTNSDDKSNSDGDKSTADDQDKGNVDDGQDDNDNGQVNGDSQDEDDQNHEEIPIDIQAMLDGKYADFDLPREKLQRALKYALAKIDYALPTFTGDNFPSHCSVNNVYSVDSNLTSGGWNTGFWTGILWHAYEITGYYRYINTASGQIPTCYERIDKRLGVNHHDMGFLYTPSCVAAYELTGDKQAKEAAI